MLWCCHVRGPDEVHAAPDYETALRWADMVNAIDERMMRTGALAGSACPLMRAVPAPWPWSPEAHAEDMPKSIAGFALAVQHKSDCAVNNAPALPPGPCDCGAAPVTKGERS